ncbi:SIMPL domain-containing protein [Rhodococcus zopfii]|uniref:SIMPL domain-containing protein n=1 Tax=Rhodococcus zopfii TaxID=43772 RepID=A0ABU3WQ81_9NOCA|nr:SIMPL domain-containing protein [Rhodococcus zopfii]
MNELTVTVAGHAEREYAPNRCTVALQVHADGATREQAADPVARAVAALTGLVTEMRERPGNPVKRWTFDQVRHSRYRPYSNEGATLPWRYTSAASITVTFHDFDAIGAFVDRVSGFEAVTVADLRWWIGRRSRQKKLARVRDLAVQNALDKAKGYTKSLGYSTFRAVAIADPGMLGLPTPPAPYPGGGPVMRSEMHAGLTSTSEESGPAFTLEPDRISITADVEARFEAP